LFSSLTALHRVSSSSTRFLCPSLVSQQEQQRLQEDLQLMIQSATPLRSVSQSRSRRSVSRSRGTGGPHSLRRGDRDEDDVDPSPMPSSHAAAASVAQLSGRGVVDVDELLSRVVTSSPLTGAEEWGVASSRQAAARSKSASRSARAVAQ
jgi:hypothetical protein